MAAESVVADIVALARGWLGTPYHHQAALKGVGCDCLGLIRGVWAEYYGQEPERPPAYSADWGEANSTETLLSAAGRHLIAIPIAHAAPGDVLVFRMRAGAIAKHAGIVSSPTTMIHAAQGRLVEETPLTAFWLRRRAAAFRFPSKG